MKLSIVLKPGFWAKAGSNVSIKITVAGTSFVAANHSQTEEETTEYAITHTQDITSSTDWVLMNIYSLTGSMVYQSNINFELQSLPLRKGIYIVEKIDNLGNAVREKVILTE
ncbi:hypothetical protein FACS189413_06440 [Bacteroidia bacterium]|nr:hypothetical protein FACS189413_06440 [Bacteroidia bacterium]